MVMSRFEEYFTTSGKAVEEETEDEDAVLAAGANTVEPRALAALFLRKLMNYGWMNEISYDEFRSLRSLPGARRLGPKKRRELRDSLMGGAAKGASQSQQGGKHRPPYSPYSLRGKRWEHYPAWGAHDTAAGIPG